MPRKKPAIADSTPTPPPPTTSMPRLPTAKNLDDVVANFDAIIKWAIATPSGIGYFASVYKRATIAIDAAVKGKEFKNPSVMAEFARIFSQRYFDSLNAYLEPREFEHATHVWQWHFTGLEYAQPIVLQHLLTALDAHINLDLGISASQVGRGNMPGLRDDFNMVNAILASQVQAVLSALGEVSPNLQKVRDTIPDGVEVAKIKELLEAFRNLAWKFATKLAETDQDGLQELVDLHDQWAGGLATCYLYPPGRLGGIVDWIAEDENRDIPTIIACLEAQAMTPQPLNPMYLV